MRLSNVTRLTPADLLVLSEGKHYELVGGVPLARPTGMKRAWITANTSSKISEYLRRNPIGDVFGGGGSYQCFPNDPSRVCRPVVSFIRAGRLPQEQFERGHVRIAPDLAVEVISPTDLHYDVNSKLEDYFSAGIPLVWLVNPDTRTVTVYRRAGADISRLQVGDTLMGDDILPGFSCPVVDLFPPPVKN